MLRKIGKGIKRFMGEKIQACKEVLSSDKYRLTIGLVMVGAGMGLVASVYLKVPA